MNYNYGLIVKHSEDIFLKLPVILSPKKGKEVCFQRTNKNSTSVHIKINVKFKLYF